MRIVRNRSITHSSQIEVAIRLDALAMILAEQKLAADEWEAAADRRDAMFQEYRKTGKVVEWDTAIAEMGGE